MIEAVARSLSPLLNWPLVRRIRRNHALEHATIHMLSRRLKTLKIAGRADGSGFYLYGEADTSLIWEAAEEALGRMKRGEAHWAVHPNCGTNLVTTSLMTSSAAYVGLVGVQNRPSDLFNRLPVVMLLSIIALIFSQPVGMAVQKHITTLGEMGDLELVDITRHQTFLPFQQQLTVHRVHTRYG
jgi:hypothetical protein